MTVPERRWVLVGEPLSREVGDEVFVLTRDSQMHWLKNASARLLWERLVAAASAGCSASELAQALADEFEVETTDAHEDVVRFCEHLGRHGLVTTAERTDESTPARPAEPIPSASHEARGRPGRG